MAVVFAGLEIEGEGKYGWAEKMPTWYRTTGIAARLYGLALGGKPLTGYHSFMFVMPILVFHVQFFMGLTWTWQAEVMAWAVYFAFAPLWDYYWFILNPAYGFGRFRKENVWWHAKSYWVLGRLPHDYFMGWGISIFLAFVAGQVTQHAVLLATMLICTVLLILMSPRYHSWRLSMDDEELDERSKAGIFHND
jgi:hypothetical protein